MHSVHPDSFFGKTSKLDSGESAPLAEPAAQSSKAKLMCTAGTLDANQEYEPPAPIIMPWTPRERYVDFLRTRLNFDAMLTGVFIAKQASIDQVMASTGWQTGNITQWLRDRFHSDPLVIKAIRRGHAKADQQKVDKKNPVHCFENVLILAVPAGNHAKQYWYLILARHNHAFTQEEVDLAGLLVRCFQAGYNQLTEPGSCRMMLGHDHRIILINPFTELCSAEHPGSLDNLLEKFPKIVHQRWPKLEDGTIHDIVMGLPHFPIWVRFVRKNSLLEPQGQHWILEIIQLELSQLPIIEILEDDRVARALAYLHDHFHEAPRLNKVAQAVDISPFHFHRIFGKIVGISPKQYLQRKQLQVAKWLLDSTRQSIGNIAKETGFASHGHFTSTFHRMLGVNPSQYREGERIAKEK